jgi:class III lanthionine synthetase
MQASYNDMKADPASMTTFVTVDLKDYSFILTAMEVPYSISGHYLQVGNLEGRRGWVLHLTATLQNAYSLVQKIVPILVQQNVPFKIPLNEEVVKGILSGIIGYPLLGKIICVYPDTTEKAVQLAKILLSNTMEFKGPLIPTDYCIGGIVFTQYSTFNPIFLVDQDGNVGNYYHRIDGSLVKEDIIIPFSLPDGVQWPFSSITKFTPIKGKSLLQGRYQVISILKNDSKGRVLKAFDAKRWWKFKYCIIKEGVPCMCMDDAGRDIRDRLEWQYKLHTDFNGIIPIPKAFDFFEEAGNAYFVMQFVKGENLSTIIDLNFKCRKWTELEVGTQLLLIKFLNEIIDNVERLHEKGFVHRDLSPRNFHITKEHRFFFLDVELAADLRINYPSPPFVLGTPGYMAPEQVNVVPPTVQQDLYGLGALMVRLFSSLSPKLFPTDDPETLFTHLFYYIGSTELVTLICSSLSYDPDQRPPLTLMKKVIGNYEENIKKKALKRPDPHTLISTDECNSLINRSIACLGSSKLATPEHIWFSKNVTREKFISNERLETSYYTGFQRGISGVLYMLSIAKAQGYSIGACKEKIGQNFSYLLSTKINEGISFEPGLYNGSAGITLFLIRALEIGMILNTPQLLDFLERSLLIEIDHPDISNGLSGHGLIMLQARLLLNTTKIDDRLATVASKLLASQEKDGSWLIKRADTNAQSVKLFGFSNGMSGILYFLLKYYALNKDTQIYTSIERGLDFLAHNAVKQGQKLWWNYSPGDKGMDPWLSYGNAGIVLPFILGYEITHLAKYKAIAEAALEHHTSPLVTPYLSLLNGAAGLGEVYLEAFRVFKNEQWTHRANDIAQLLAHSYHVHSDGSICWITDNSTLPTADLLVGNAGVIYFLMRILNPLQMQFPIT